MPQWCDILNLVRDGLPGQIIVNIRIIFMSGKLAVKALAKPQADSLP